MNLNRQRWGRLAAPAVLLVLAACGSSETTTPPPVSDNPFANATVGTDSTLEVMTWNLETFPVNGAVTVDLVAKAVAGVDADIVALQEVISESNFQRVIAQLEGWGGYRATGAPYDQNLAFLYRTDGLLAVTGFHEIFTHDSRPFPRPPLVMECTWNGQRILVINNHLKCCGDNVIDEADVWDETTRRRDACVLLDEYVEANEPGTPVVIVGDWNDELDDPAAGNVFANFLADTVHWRFADLPIAQGEGGRVSYPSWGSHLDHILITDELFAAAEKTEALIEVVPLNTYLSGGMSAYYRDLSDHLPVLLRLTP